MTASDLLLLVSGCLGLVVAPVVVYRGQKIASRKREANAPQRQIDWTIATSLALGTVLTIGAVVALTFFDDRTTTQKEAMSPYSIVIPALGQLLLIGIGMVFVVRHVRAVKRLNELGPDHPLSRRTTLDLRASPSIILGWAKSAARSAHAVDIEIDAEHDFLEARAPASWREGGRLFTIQVRQSASDASHVEICSWPTNMLKQDFGTGQYFVDRLAEKLREISEDPPEPRALTPLRKWG
jgi:hypothetical protein